jgi:hypothetical protein
MTSYPEDSLKTCSRCKVEKPRSAFGKDSKRYDKKSIYCKECRSIQSAERRADPEKAERARESTRKWRANNPEKAKESNRKSKAKEFANNPEKVRARNRKNGAAWRARHPETVKERNAAWSRENRDKRNEMQNNWRAKNRPEVNAKQTAKRWEGREHLRDQTWLARPHVGYIWHWPDGTVAYVGITHRDLKERTGEHKRESEWVAEGAIPPESAALEFATGWDGQAWEREQVLAAIERGDDIRNITHHPDR